jgi:hypothetical protein
MANAQRPNGNAAAGVLITRQKEARLIVGKKASNHNKIKTLLADVDQGNTIAIATTSQSASRNKLQPRNRRIKGIGETSVIDD